MEILKPYRAKIDSLDDQIVDLLVERMRVIHEVADIKAAQGIPAILQDRVDEVRERCVARAAEKGMDPEIVRELYARLIEYCCQVEDDIIAKPTKRSA